MEVFLSVGEPSGDLHGANLISQMRNRRPDIGCVGFGGPRMAEAGCELLAEITGFAVMWLWQAVIRIPKFLMLLHQADQYFKTQRPSAVVLVDFPGFNWWVARRAKARGIPVFYYGVPQIWAWAPWRVRKLKRLTDHVLCKLPFEPDWFAQFGCNAHFVGHPYFDELASRQLDQQLIERLREPASPLVALLPGSRTQEVTANLPLMITAAQEVANICDDVRFAIASYNDAQCQLAQEILRDKHAPVQIFVGKTAELIEAADACVACSGSVSLELLYHTTPAIIVYRISRWAYALQDRFRLAKYITLVNLLACQNIDRRTPCSQNVPFPEYLIWKDDTAAIARDLVKLLTDPQYRDGVVEQLRALKYRHAKPGASRRAADYIVNKLSSNATPVLKPHFRSSADPPHVASVD